MSLDNLFQTKKVIINIGPGGVGKTSCSIALAFRAAACGKKVGLLSIDPAKRLAKALDLNLNGFLRPLDLSSCDLKGSIDAAMLDQKLVFDDMVRKHSPSMEISNKIINHALYRTASEKLASSLEYMALAKLQDMIDKNQYDLVILDTPPDTNALAFLDKPNILSGFMEHQVMNWLIKPFHFAEKLGIRKLLTLGERLMGGLAKVTGFQALSMLSEFLVLMQNVIEGFHAASQRVKITLSSHFTSFIVVTAPEMSAITTTKNLVGRMKQYGYFVDAVIINKCLPDFVRDACKKSLSPEAQESFSISHLFQQFQNEKNLIEQLNAEKNSLSLYFVAEQQMPIHSITAMFKLSGEFGAQSY